jgi:hypothetical protein
MSVEGLCRVCESAVAEHRCRRSLVCATHYDRETGLCTGCAADLHDWGRGVCRRA